MSSLKLFPPPIATRIVTITSGGSVDVARWIDKVGALLQNWYPGQEGGTALAEILCGDVNPSGRLPISWERNLDDNPSMLSYYPNPGTLKIPYKDDVFVGYRGYEHNRVKPRFPFGFGLGYTNFKYANLQIRPTQGAGAYEVSFDVTNTGNRAGADVAQVYVGEDHPPVARPPQELKGFARLTLQPGETRRVSIPLDARSFTWYDEKGSGMARRCRLVHDSRQPFLCRSTTGGQSYASASHRSARY